MGISWIDLCQCLDFCISCIHQPQKELSLTFLGRGEMILYLSLLVDSISIFHTYLGNSILLPKAKAGIQRKGPKWKTPTATQYPLIPVKEHQ